MQQSLSNLEFRYVAYDQDCVLLGSKGSGKSYLANKILQSLNGINVWVYDFLIYNCGHQSNDLFGNSPIKSDFREGQILYIRIER